MSGPNCPVDGTSMKTLRAMLAYIEVARPALLIFENVESIGDNSNGNDTAAQDDAVALAQTNLELVLAEFHSRGYECQKFLGSSILFGVPQNRKRWYIIGIQMNANEHLNPRLRSISDVFETLRSLIKVCQRQAPCASKLMLEADHPRVRQELERRQEQEASGQKQKRSYAVGTAIMAQAAKGTSWSAATGRVPAVLKDSPWFWTLSSQQQKLAALSVSEDPSPLLIRDIGQSSTRIRTSTITEDGRHRSMTVTPAQLGLLSCPGETPRLMLGEEAMLLQGYPTAAVPDLVAATSNHQLAILAGNAVSVPVLLALMMASVAAVDWRPALPPPSPGPGPAAGGGDGDADAEAIEEDEETAAQEALNALAQICEGAAGSTQDVGAAPAMPQVRWSPTR